MAHRKKLGRVKGIPEGSVARLNSRGILTCKHFLSRTPLELMDVLDVTYPRLQQLVRAVSRACAPTSRTALSMHQHRSGEDGGKFLPTSISELDLILKGGLPPSTITEVSGPSGCGKTQFCLMLAVQSALPEDAGGRGTPVVYVDTEGAFSAERLIEMTSCRLRENSTPQTPGEQSHLTELAKCVHVFKPTTVSSFTECLAGLEVVLAREGAGLLVVDSIASLVRKEFDVTTRRGAVDRTSTLLRQAARLKYLAEAFNIQVVVTNQIVTKLSHDVLELSTLADTGGGGGEEEGVVTAALGNAWYHSVTTRLLLEPVQGAHRLLSVLKSPMCKLAGIRVKIDQMGLIPAATEHGDEAEQVQQVTTGARSANYHRGFAVEYPGQFSPPQN